MPEDRVDQYRQSVPAAEPATNSTPEVEPDAVTTSNSDTIDTDPTDQGSPPVADTNS